MGKVYFFYARPSNAVRIGLTNKPTIDTAFKNINAGYPGPLEILWVKDGELTNKVSLQKQFQSLRIYGDWFKCEGELETFLQERNPGFKEHPQYYKPTVRRTATKIKSRTCVLCGAAYPFNSISFVSNGPGESDLKGFSRNGLKFVCKNCEASRPDFDADVQIMFREAQQREMQGRKVRTLYPLDRR